MTDEELLGWLEKRLEEVAEAMKNHSEEDKLDSLWMLEETTRRVKIAIEHRYAVSNRAYSKYVAPWRTK